MATMEGRITPTEQEEGKGLLGSLKKAVGLGPKEHKVDSLHEEPSPRSYQVSEQPKMYENQVFESEEERVRAQKLLKPQEVEVGLEKPDTEEYSAEQESYKTAPMTPEHRHEELKGRQYTSPTSHEEQEAPAGTQEPLSSSERTRPVATTTTATTTTVGGVSPVSNVVRRLEGAGYEHKGSVPLSGTADKGEKKEEPMWEAPPEPVQGDRVNVSRVGVAKPGGMPVTGGMAAIEARPNEETKPMSGQEAADMAAGRSSLLAAEKEREIDAKKRQLEALRTQAEELERQSQALLEDANKEKERIDSALAQKQRIEHAEWRGYSAAEQAEQQRRQVVERAHSAVSSAQELEAEAIRLRQSASDVEYHAQVLERRAKALVEESGDMAKLSSDKTAEASAVAAELSLRRQEAQDIRNQIDTQAALGLPQYIQDCEREIGSLMRRVAELREEIGWAQQEINNARDEADAWRRILVAKESVAANLLMRLNLLREDAELARLRAANAAEEAGEPARLAEEKYMEAWELGRQAAEMEERAIKTQEEATELAKAAIEPARERQVHLREAADAEAVLRQVDAQVDIVAGKAERHLAEAEVKASTAARYAEQAQRMEEELVTDRKYLEAHKAESEMHTVEMRSPMPVPVV